MDNELSPFWPRNYGKLQGGLSADNPMCKNIFENNYDSIHESMYMGRKSSNVLKTYNVNGIVVAHTPQKDGINQTCGGKIWRTDVGLSSVFASNHPKYGKMQVLEILNDKNVKVISL